MTKNTPAPANDNRAEPTENEDMFGHLTAEEREHAGLTDAERASMDEGDEDGDVTGDVTGDADGDGEGDDGDADDGDVTGDGEEGDEDGADGAEAGETGAEAGAEGADDGADEEETPITEADYADDPLLDTRSILPTEWRLNENTRNNLADLDRQAAELATKFDEGDLSAAEYRQQADAVNIQRENARAEIRDSERAFARAQQHWEGKTVQRFLRDNPDFVRNKTTLTILDAEVRRLQATAGDPFDPRILLRARDNLTAALGGQQAPQRQPANDNRRSANDNRQQQQQRGKVIPNGKRAPIPPTLARVPSDDISDADGGKYARLDRLATRNPDAFQEALMKLPAAEREEYLASAA